MTSVSQTLPPTLGEKGWLERVGVGYVLLPGKFDSSKIVSPEGKAR